MAEIAKVSYLDKSGVLELATGILNNVNTRINERIVTTIDASSDDMHVASAAAVYKAIQSMSHVKLKTVTGDISSVEVPESNVIYLQRATEEDSDWLMYIHDETIGWICIGNTKLDLENYWSKSPEDLESMKEQIGINNLLTEVDKKVNTEDLTALTSDDIQEIITTSYENTEVFTSLP